MPQVNLPKRLGSQTTDSSHFPGVNVDFSQSTESTFRGVCWIVTMTFCEERDPCELVKKQDAWEKKSVQDTPGWINRLFLDREKRRQNVLGKRRRGKAVRNEQAE